MQIFLFLLALPAFADSSLLVLRQGEMKSIQLRSNAPIRVSSSQVVRVIDQGPRILLVGRKIGQAVLSHGEGSYRVEVVSSPVQQTYEAFKKASLGMKGLVIDVDQNRVLVRGRLLRWRDWNSFRSHYAATGGAWVLKSTIDPFVLEKAKKELQLVGLVRRLPRHSIVLTPKPVLLASASAVAQSSLKMYADEYGLETQVDTTLLGESDSVRLRLTFAEVQGDAGERLGLKFDDGQSVQLLPKLTAPQELSAALLYLANQGQAKVLATPSLVARSGTEAEFLAGGEFAVRTSNHRARDVTWKRHGLWLKFKPQLDPRGVVRIDIQTEFSMPDFSGAVDGVPSLRSSRTNSSVDVTLGKTILLSGLVRSWSGESWSGVKGLAELPVIGRLFRSQDFAESRTELMVFITPELVSGESDHSEENGWN